MSEATDLPTEQVGKNRIGFTGFLLSIGGLLTLGLLSPFALLLSSIGLAKRPRGFAAAGTALSVIGVGLLTAIGVSGYFLATFAGPALAEFAVESVAMYVGPLVRAADAIDGKLQKTGNLPNPDEGNKLIAEFRSFSGRALEYTTDGKAYSITVFDEGNRGNVRDGIRLEVQGPQRRIITAGPDGRFGTPDDNRSEPLPTRPPGSGVPAESK